MPEDPTEGPPEIVVWEEGTEALARHGIFGPWVEAIGPVRIARSAEGPFYYLTRAICYQQLAGAAARAIHGRVLDTLGGDVTPEHVLGTPEDELRGAGLSRSKLKAIRDLADKIRSTALVVDDLEDQSDEEVVRRLTSVWGIGEWTAHMYLMFRLGRPDVWPVGDLGVRAGYAKAHGLDPAPTAGELSPRGDSHRPWRSAVAWYSWRILETELS